MSSSSNLHVIYMISVSFVFRIYTILSHIYMFKCKNLHDIYMIINWKHVKVQKPCKLSFTVNFHGFTCYLHIIYVACKFSIFPVRFNQYLARKQNISLEAGQKRLVLMFKNSLLSAPCRLPRMLINNSTFNFS